MRRPRLPALWRLAPALLLALACFSGRPAPDFTVFVADFAKGYEALRVPELTLDHREYFSSIPDELALDAQGAFFRKQEAGLHAFDRTSLKQEDRIRFDHMHYEVRFGLERLALEKAWAAAGRPQPSGGLYSLPDREGWYRFFARRFTSRSLAPDQIMQLGHSEVARVKQEMRQLRQGLGFADSAAFQRQLLADSFLITDKAALVRAFERTDSTVRRHLAGFAGPGVVPPVVPIEWPGAGANTPPGIYLNRENNPYGRDVFQYNFYNRRYNRRAVEWLYMHEALPGHHLQFSMRARMGEDPLQRLFSYPGNFEGWACYVEYFGQDLGLYRDPYSKLGHLEWDLVRSARLVLDAGIHARGWTRDQALAYWRAAVPGQDEIAEREVTRVTNWPGQALSYKLGAGWILRQRAAARAREGTAFSAARFNRSYLAMGMRPLEVLEAEMGG